jgi:hypothetical protein
MKPLSNFQIFWLIPIFVFSIHFYDVVFVMSLRGGLYESLLLLFIEAPNCGADVSAEVHKKICTVALETYSDALKYLTFAVKSIFLSLIAYLATFFFLKNRQFIVLNFIWKLALFYLVLTIPFSLGEMLFDVVYVAIYLVIMIPSCALSAYLIKLKHNKLQQ